MIVEVDDVTDSERLFSSTPVLRLFFMAAIPGAIGMLMQSAYDLADGVLVGRFVSETAFAAINLAMPFVYVNFAFGDLIGVGSAVPISHAQGRGERALACNIFTCACIMNVAFGFLTGLLFLLVSPHLMAMMGATGELQAQATLYLRVYAAFLPITSICFAIDNYLRICGKINRSLFCNALLAGTGLVLELLLLGFFDLGVGAAALSYCIAIAVSVCVGLWPFYQRRLYLSFCRPHFSFALVSGIVRNGAPAFLENVAGRVTAVVLNTVLLAVGGLDAVSIYGVAMFCDAFLVPLVYGVVDSMQPAVGFNWGAKNLERVRSLEVCCFVAAAAVSLVLAFVVFMWPEAITLVFLPEAEEALVASAAHALRIVSFSFILRWLPFAVQSYMVAVGQSRLAAICSVSQSLVFPLVTLAVLSPLGLEGLWLNMPVSTVAASVLSLGIIALFRATVRERMERAR